MSVRQDADLLQGPGNGSDEPTNKRQRRQVRKENRTPVWQALLVACLRIALYALLLSLCRLPARCLTCGKSADDTSESGITDVAVIATGHQRVCNLCDLCADQLGAGCCQSALCIAYAPRCFGRNPSRITAERAKPIPSTGPNESGWST